MKTLKTWLLLFVIASFAIGSLEASAQPAMRKRAHHAIRRTAIVIQAAYKNVKEGKVYTGDLARSIAHQHYARVLFRNGFYPRAIHHTRRARMLALIAIKANKGVEISEGTLTPEEEELLKNSPSDEELEKELLKEMPKEKMKDEDVIGTVPDVELRDKE